MKKIYFLIIIASFITEISNAETYYTTATGDWLTGNKWSTNTTGTGGLFSTIDPPTLKTGDTLYIDNNTTINSADVVLETVDITIILDATLSIAKKLRLSENSQIIFTNNGYLDPTGPGNSEKIGFGGTFVWTGNNGPEAGPGTMDRNYNPNVGLPIELTSFLAEVNNGLIELNWITAKEEKFSHFELERSLDQKSFEMIGIIQGQGESFSDVHYDFEDSDAPYGKIYYRLKAGDIDETFEYSHVISVENSFKGQLSVYPNPVQENSEVKIRVPGKFTENISYLALYNIQGSLVQEFIDFNPSDDLKINAKVISGMYLLKVQHNGLEENIRVYVK